MSAADLLYLLDKGYSPVPIVVASYRAYDRIFTNPNSCSKLYSKTIKHYTDHFDYCQIIRFEDKIVKIPGYLKPVNYSKYIEISVIIYQQL